MTSYADTPAEQRVQYRGKRSTKVEKPIKSNQTNPKQTTDKKGKGYPKPAVTTGSVKGKVS